MHLQFFVAAAVLLASASTLVRATGPVSTQAPVVSPPISQTQSAKRLKRRIYEFGLLDDHKCTLERHDREEDYLAALSQKDIDGYLKLASDGDADAMYLLALYPVETKIENPEGKREYPYREPWLARSAAAGHPIAKYLIAEEAHQKKIVSDNDYLALIETAALAQGSGDIAWRLAYSYKNPTAEKGDVVFRIPRNFLFLKGDKPKALHWARLAAAKGNMMAAEDLCSTMYLNTVESTYGLPHRDLNETVRWCTLAAQAPCSSSGALSMSGLYRQGIGVTKSLVDALYWKNIYEERERRTGVPLGRFEYIGDNNRAK